MSFSYSTLIIGTSDKNITKKCCIGTILIFFLSVFCIYTLYILKTFPFTISQISHWWSFYDQQIYNPLPAKIKLKNSNPPPPQIKHSIPNPK